MSNFEEGDDQPTVVGNNDDDPSKAGYESGDSEVSTEPFIHDPTLAKYQTSDYQDKWNEELEACKKERKDFITKGYKILEHWADKRPTDNQRSHYNLLFANTELKQAALYANTPSPDIKRRYNDPNDQVSRVAALILTRKIETELDDEDFDSTIKQIINDRLLPGMGIAWLRIEQEGGDDYLPFAGQTVPEMEPQTFPEGHPQQGQPTGMQVPTGNQVPHPQADQVSQTPITQQCTPVDHVSWDDFLWSPCRTWKMCRWVGRRIPMSKKAVEDRFGGCCPKVTLDALCFQQQKESKQPDKDLMRTKNQVESTTDVIEIWDKELKMIWWIGETADVPLDVQEDTNKFPGFFPTPRNPLGRFDGSNTIPHPDYHFSQDLYRLLDQQNDRLTKYIQAAQLKFVYDNANPELKDLLTTTGEFGGIGVNNWASFVTEKGGLKNAIQFLPIDDIVNASINMAKSMELTKSQILQIEGLAGPFQAESVPNETVLATQQKAAFGTSRLSITQKDVATYIQEILRLKAHLICKFYTQEQMLEGTGTLSQGDQQLIPQAIQMLKNEQLRNFKLEVSVDSIQLPNWNLEKADKAEAFKAITGALGEMLPAVQQNPMLAPLALKTIQWLITGFKGAQYIEGEIDNALAQITAASQAKQGQPPQPTPEQLKAQSHTERGQVDLQITKMEEQTKQMIAAQDTKIDMMRIQIDKGNQALEAQKIVNQAKDNIHDHAMDQIQQVHTVKDSLHDHALDVMNHDQADRHKAADLTLVLGRQQS